MSIYVSMSWPKNISALLISTACRSSSQTSRSSLGSSTSRPMQVRLARSAKSNGRSGVGPLLPLPIIALIEVASFLYSIDLGDDEATILVPPHYCKSATYHLREQVWGKLADQPQ